MTPPEYTKLALMPPILLLAFAIGAAGLNADPIWTDELYSLSNIGAFDPPYSPMQIIESLKQNSPQHTPLYFLLAGAWARLAGWTQFALRIPSTYAGVVMIAWTYRLAADLFGRRVGLTAAFLMATSAFPLVFFHEIRMYSLLMMLGVMQLCLYWRLTRRTSAHRLTWWLFILTTSALLYTHSFSTLLLAALGLYHLLFARKARRYWRIIPAWIAGGLIFLPYLPVVYAGFLEETNKLSTVSAAFAPSELLRAFITLAANGSAPLFSTLILMLLFRLWQTRGGTAFRFAMFAALLLIALLAVNFQFRLFGQDRSRYLLPLWLPFIPLFAYGIAGHKPWRMPLAICLLLWSAAAFQFQRSGAFLEYASSMIFARRYPPLQEYARQLDGLLRPEDFLLGFTTSDYLNSERKHGVSAADYYTQALLGIDGAFIRKGLTGGQLQDDLIRKVDDNPYVLLAYEPNDEPANLKETRAALSADYAPCAIVINAESLFVQRYVYRSLTCERQYEPVHFANGIRIVDKFGDYDAEGQTVGVVTGWEVPEETMLDEYNVSLQIFNAAGQRQKQIDQHLYSDVLKWYAVEFSTADLPPGDYSAVVMLYDRESVRNISGVDIASGLMAEIFPIHPFTVQG